MKRWGNLPAAAALLPAIAAAVMSSQPLARQDVTNYLSEARAPQAADLGEYTTDS
jgi:hypothetical protein